MLKCVRILKCQRQILKEKWGVGCSGAGVAAPVALGAIVPWNSFKIMKYVAYDLWSWARPFILPWRHVINHREKLLCTRKQVREDS